MVKSFFTILFIGITFLPMELFAYSYAEVLAGLVSPTGIVSYKDNEAARMTTGSTATTITINGLFDTGQRFSLCPSYSYLSTDGKVKNSTDPFLPPNYTIRYQQNEFALDILYRTANFSRLRFGPGIATSWWVAAESKDLPPTYYQIEDTRVSRGYSFLARGTVHWMLRSPSVSGASFKLVGAVPLTNLLKINNSSASGYIGIHIGFSMILL